MIPQDPVMLLSFINLKLREVIIVVVITTIITPILLKIVFKSGPNVSTLEKGKEVTSFYEDIEKKRTE